MNQLLRRAGLVASMCACVVLLAASQASALLIDEFTDDITDMEVFVGGSDDSEHEQHLHRCERTGGPDHRSDERERQRL
jgi:uncharacterized OsmC-like protein